MVIGTEDEARLGLNQYAGSGDQRQPDRLPLLPCLQRVRAFVDKQKTSSLRVQTGAGAPKARVL